MGFITIIHHHLGEYFLDVFPGILCKCKYMTAHTHTHPTALKQPDFSYVSFVLLSTFFKDDEGEAWQWRLNTEVDWMDDAHLTWNPMFVFKQLFVGCC